MKILTRLKLWSKKKVEETFEVDSIEQLESLLSKCKEDLSNCKSKYYTSLAREKHYSQEIDKAQEVVDKATQKAKNNKDDAEITKHMFEIINKTKKELCSFESHLSAQEKCTKQIEQVKNQLESKTIEIEHKLQLMKTKQEFSDFMEDFEKLTVSGDINLEEVEKEINIEYDANVFKLDDMSKEVNLDLDSLDYNEFLQSL